MDISNTNLSGCQQWRGAWSVLNGWTSQIQICLVASNGRKPGVCQMDGHLKYKSVWFPAMEGSLECVKWMDISNTNLSGCQQWKEAWSVLNGWTSQIQICLVASNGREPGVCQMDGHLKYKSVWFPAMEGSLECVKWMDISNTNLSSC